MIGLALFFLFLERLLSSTLHTLWGGEEVSPQTARIVTSEMGRTGSEFHPFDKYSRGRMHPGAAGAQKSGWSSVSGKKMGSILTKVNK